MAAIEPHNLPDKRYFRIGEVCDLTGLKPHVLRYWETEFRQVKPHKTRSNQRLYRKKDVETILLIKHLLYDQKFTIAGARTRLEERRKKDEPAAPAGPRQLSIDFDPGDRTQMISAIIAELEAVRDILDNK